MDFLRQIIIFRGIKKEIFEPIECPHTPFQRPLRPLCMQQLTCKNFKKLEAHQSSPLEEKRRNSYERTLKPGTILINDFLFEGGVERVKSCVIYKTKFLHDWFSGMMIWRKRISCKREGMHKCVPLVGRVGNDAKASSGSKTNRIRINFYEEPFKSNNYNHDNNKSFFKVFAPWFVTETQNKRKILWKRTKLVSEGYWRNNPDYPLRKH